MTSNTRLTSAPSPRWDKSRSLPARGDIRWKPPSPGSCWNMPGSAPTHRPCARRPMASGRPPPGPSWRNWSKRWPAACTRPVCSAGSTWWSSVPTAPACTPPCWQRNRWAPSRCRSTRTRWRLNACFPSTTPRCASWWWKTRNRSTRCWRSASSARNWPGSFLTTRAACATTTSPACRAWTRWWPPARPMPPSTRSVLHRNWNRAARTTWRPCSSPAAPPVSPRAWCTPTARSSTGPMSVPASTA